MDMHEVFAVDRKHGAQIYSPLEIVLTRGEGVWVYDSEGQRYLDCLSSYSALNQGHCHPRLVRALTEQAQRLTLSSRAFYTDQYPRLLKRLAEVTGYEAALPMNTGVEAVETSLKLVRKWGYTVKGVPANEAEIIVAANNFHGRTITAISFSTEQAYREHFGPFTPGFVAVEYGDLEALKAAITPRTAGILLEPIQGEAGVIVPPAGYLQAVADLCREQKILLVLDEIQTGLGRTGKLFAHQHEGVRPDVVLLGKALGGGMYPVSSVLADRALMDLFRPGEHGSTFGGNPLGAAVAVEALNVLVEEELVENAAVQGEYLLQALQQLESPYIKEVRGKGLLIGIELHESAGGARRFCEALKELGVLCKETHDHVIRIAPPLLIDRLTIDWAVSRLQMVLCPEEIASRA